MQYIAHGIAASRSSAIGWPQFTQSRTSLLDSRERTLDLPSTCSEFSSSV